MILPKAWQRTALWLGIGWSLLWSLLLSELPLIQQLDLSQYDRAIRLNSPGIPPPEIVLVNITNADLKTWGLVNEAIIYSKLVDRLFDANAAVVVLNLLPSWIQTSDHPNNPIKNLIRKHSDRIVLVLPTSSATQLYPTEWRSYEYFLPVSDKNKPLFPPQSILGFAEYEPEAKNPRSYSSTARQASLSGQFILSRNLNSTQTLNSSALLALKKLQPQQQSFSIPQTPIQIHFWGATGTFRTLEARSLLNDDSLLSQLHNKIVLVGFFDTNNPDTFAIRSPFGELMPAVELQANLLASLLTKSFARIVPLWLQNIVILLGGILISKWVVCGKLSRLASRKYWYWLYPLFGLSVFGIVSLLTFSQGWILPITLPLLTWMATGLSVFISLLLGVQKDLINQQQCEIDRLHSIEQTAAISQAKKMLHRLTANIHEGPLQELKLIMDRLEILQFNEKTANLDPILEQLESLGYHLRQQLNQTRAITLEITPELKSGLDVGIKTKLQRLVNSGELTLQIITQLESLEEPEFNSLWLEVREDIYHFFCEAIHNVICHAQPPHGTATQVRVSLSQQDTRCTLTIKNDGAQVDLSQFERLGYAHTSRSQILGINSGYGMKLMEMIASQLPDGKFETVVLSEGGIQIQLTWTQIFNN